MKYTLNGEPRDSGKLSIAEIVRELTDTPDTAGVAVAVNAEVVPRSGWDRLVTEGDVVDVLTAVQGG